MVRGAFTLIELIFAIVVMSIVMLAFPMIMQTDSDAREQNMAQEAALAASAKLAQILTYQWDERSLNWDDLAENHQTAAHLLDGTNTETTAFDRNATSGKRASQSSHRTFFPTQTNASAIGVDDNNTLVGGVEAVVGMDELGFNFAAHSGFDTGYLKDSFGYKRDYQMKVDIFPVDDGNGIDYTQTTINFVLSHSNSGGQTNLRCAEVSIQDGNGKLLTRLYGYAANIGEYKVHSEPRP